MCLLQPLPSRWQYRALSQQKGSPPLAHALYKEGKGVHRGVLLLIHTQNPCGQVVFQLEEAKPGFAPRTRCFQSWKSFPRILRAPREEGSYSG